VRSCGFHVAFLDYPISLLFCIALGRLRVSYLVGYPLAVVHFWLRYLIASV
jgi:hypothetical protein